MKQLKLGRKPVRHDKRSLKLRKYLPTLPPIPNATDWGGAVTSWGMLLNDVEGDCTCAGAGHSDMLWSINAGAASTVTDDQIQAAYIAITGYDPSKTDAQGNNPTDTGANMLDVLNYWRQNGIAGNEINCYVTVDWNNFQELAAAIFLFGTVYIGINLPQSAMDAFNAGQVWSNTTDTNILGGHCVIITGYDLTARTVRLVTWGQEITATLDWLTTYCEEAYVPCSRSWMKANGQSPSGMNFTQLQADLAEVQAQPA